MKAESHEWFWSRRRVVTSSGLMGLIGGTAQAEGSIWIVETKTFTTTNFDLQSAPYCVR